MRIRIKLIITKVKQNQRRTVINKIISNGKTFIKQDEISKAIHQFYKKLYTEIPVETNTERKHFLSNLPRLDESERIMLDSPLTLEELRSTVNTCDDSAPGPDGLSYRIYKDHWDILGPEILNTWLVSVRLGKTTQTQRTSIITLLEKKGKDQSNLENLRPISLSNCDIKICTKTLH